MLYVYIYIYIYTCRAEPALPLAVEAVEERLDRLLPVDLDGLRTAKRYGKG